MLRNVVTERIDEEPLEQDSVSLTWEGRQRCRQRLITQAGREIGIALHTGTILFPGDVLYRNKQLEIVVEGVPEKVFVLRPETRETFGMVCYQIGNLHRPIGFHEGAILIPYEPILEKQLDRLGWTYIIDDRIFTHTARQSHTHFHVH